MATTPAFANTPNLGTDLNACRISAANTNRDGTGTVYSLVTGGANGTRVDRVTITAISSTTTGMIRFYLKDNAGSPHTRLVKEILVNAITPSGVLQAFAYEWCRNGLNGQPSDGQPVALVPNGWQLLVSTNNAESFDVVPSISNNF